MKRLFIICAAIVGILVAAVAAYAATPTITSTSPVDGATGVALNANITVTFDPNNSADTMRSNTIVCNSNCNDSNNSYFRIRIDGGSYKNGTVTYDAATKTATFDPQGNLEPNTRYRARLTNDVRNSSGDRLSEYTFYFTTGSGGSDTTPPTIVSVSPVNNATGISLTPTITVYFSEDMDATSITTAGNITLYNGGTAVACVFTYDAANKAANCTPATLLSNTLYTASVTTNVKDVALNALAATYIWRFTTLSSDSIRPTVDSVTPANNATAVAVTTNITATFSEQMAPLTMVAANFTVKDSNNNSVAGSVTYDSILHALTFDPASNLSNSMTYTATITNSVTDLAGNALAANYVWHFTTISLVPPTLMSNFCQTPSFITTNSRVKPNVLLIVDNSGSTNSFAYKGTASVDNSYSSTATYYGYFETEQMYRYNSTNGYFAIDASLTLSKTTTLESGVNNYASGNFLNWLTMRRTDVIKKVLVGGLANQRNAGTATWLIGYTGSSQDNNKTYNSKYYDVDNGQIRVCGSSSCSSSGFTATYNIRVHIGNNPPADGVVTRMNEQINFAIMNFNDDGTRYEDQDTSVKDGGVLSVAFPLSTTTAAAHLTTLTNSIEAVNPGGYTPLAESLYEATRVFEATASAYGSTIPGGGSSYADPMTAACQKNFVMIITDGESTKDRNLPGSTFTGSGYGTLISDISGGNFNIATLMDSIATNEGTASQKSTSLGTDGSYYLEGVAYYAHKTDLRSPTLGATNILGKQNLTIYTVFAFDDSAYAKEILKMAAKYGGFEDKDNDGVPYVSSTCGTASPNTKCTEWDKDGNGVPDNYFEASSGDQLVTSISNALNDILANVASATATSILSSSEGSGAELLQAIFFPKKVYGAVDLTWMGEMQNMWYYLDPAVNNSRIREDTTNDFMLNLAQDYIIDIRYDTSLGTTAVDRYPDVNANGSPDSSTPLDNVSMDSFKALWRAGKKLFERDISSDARTIYTTLTGAANSQISFLNTTSFDPASSTVQTILQAANNTEAAKIINYTKGVDQTGYRTRTATIGSTSGTWKLGDIISSTPKVQSNRALNTYNLKYSDPSYQAFVNSSGSSGYRSRGMVYVGANDGMLHAVNFGIIDQTTSGNTKAKVCPDNSGNSLCESSEMTSTELNKLGREEWAFIPKNVLPYLKYMGDPNYCHIYTVDLTPTIIDASIGSCTVTADSKNLSTTGYWDCPKDYKVCSNSSTTSCTNDTDCTSPGTCGYSYSSWRTVLIGGMRLGGGCKATATTNGVGVPVSGEGYSSYFALDVTTPSAPQLLWEFVPPSHDMGFTFSGPSIVRINARAKSTDTSTTSSPRKDRNGRWFAVFASGPTGPIDTTYGQFKGFSDQQLRLFVVDLKDGTLVRTIDTYADGSKLPSNAFGGSMLYANMDYDNDYQDDAIYLGYVNKAGTCSNSPSTACSSDSNCTSPGTCGATWTDTNPSDGGVLRLVTKEDLGGLTVADTALNPDTWEVSDVMKGIGPVTSAIAQISHYPSAAARPDKAYLFFGTGRYFYTIPNNSDEPTTQRRLFGITEPCLTNILSTPSASTQTCTSSETRSFGSLDDATSRSATSTASADPEGWYITLSASSASDYAERSISSPVVLTNGAVFYSTVAPGTDVCTFGGKSYLWAVKYDTGGSVANYLKGTALLQTSTGAIEEVNLHDDFDYQEGRRTEALSGITSAPPALATSPQPLKKIMHIKKR